MLNKIAIIAVVVAVAVARECEQGEEPKLNDDLTYTCIVTPPAPVKRQADLCSQLEMIMIDGVLQCPVLTATVAPLVAKPRVGRKADIVPVVCAEGLFLNEAGECVEKLEAAPALTFMLTADDCRKGEEFKVTPEGNFCVIKPATSRPVRQTVLTCPEGMKLSKDTVGSPVCVAIPDFLNCAEGFEMTLVGDVLKCTKKATIAKRQASTDELSEEEFCATLDNTKFTAELGCQTIVAPTASSAAPKSRASRMTVTEEPAISVAVTTTTTAVPAVEKVVKREAVTEEPSTDATTAQATDAPASTTTEEASSSTSAPLRRKCEESTEATVSTAATTIKPEEATTIKTEAATSVKTKREAVVDASPPPTTEEPSTTAKASAATTVKPEEETSVKSKREAILPVTVAPFPSTSTGEFTIEPLKTTTTTA